MTLEEFVSKLQQLVTDTGGAVRLTLERIPVEGGFQLEIRVRTLDHDFSLQKTNNYAPPAGWATLFAEALNQVLAEVPTLPKLPPRYVWQPLPQEPCRFCREVGGVVYLREEGCQGLYEQAVRCTRCRRLWDADSALA